MRAGRIETYNDDKIHLSIAPEEAMADANFADKTIWTDDNLDNLQLLCSSRNRIKGDRPHEYLVARLAEIGV